MRGILKEAQAGRTAFSPEEQALIQEWVPQAMSRDQIRAALAPVADQIQAAPKEGQEMGIAMKHLAGQTTGADDVRAVLAEMRG